MTDVRLAQPTQAGKRRPTSERFELHDAPLEARGVATGFLGLELRTPHPPVS
jgi:hypothetical protein